MNLYFILYTSITIISLYGAVSVWARYKNISGIFFLLYGICTAIWFILYFAFFANVGSIETLLMLSRVNYGISGMGIYFLLYFIYFFQTQPTRTIRIKLILVGLLSCCIFGISAFTPYIIYDLSYDAMHGIYREVFGIFGKVYLGLYILFIPLFAFFIKKKINEQIGINRVRLMYISFSSAIFLTVGVIFQIILPFFDIWIFEREMVILFGVYILSILLILKRYIFTSIGYNLGRGLSLILAGISSIIAINISHSDLFKKILISGFWGGGDTYGVGDFIIGMSIFFITYKYASEYVFGSILTHTLHRDIKHIKRLVSNTKNLESLNMVLENEMHKIFRATYSQIFYITKDERKTHPIVNYFSNYAIENIFIKDIAFIEESRYNSGIDGLLKYLPERVLILFPIYGTENSIIAAYAIGAKSFGDFYDTSEMHALHDIVDFIAKHLHYIEIYDQLEDISRNLDRRVDEKTIEYNTLISRQKEFISTLSHEVKTPVTSTILQLDNILDDIEHDRIGIASIQEELVLLSEHLIETGELLSRLFSIEHMDRQNVKLYREIVDIKKLLLSQYALQKKIHTSCNYIESIDPNIGYLHIDKTQFTQVITNLLGNAIKFANTVHPEIYLEAQKDAGGIIIIVEDNGKGIDGIELKDIFEKYTIGNNSVGLGIGLYLCRKIIDLHGGSISAQKGEKLSGVRIKMYIPSNIS